MTGYDLHLEARFDLSEIWGLDASERVVAEILDAIRALAPLCVEAPGPDRAAAALYHGSHNI